MPDPSVAQTATDWAHTFLIWVGFGTCAGMVAKAVIPGRAPGGPIATLLMGIGGTCIGLGMLCYFSGGQRITPISALGFVCASGGAAVLMFFHKLLGGYFISEQGEGYGAYGGYGRRRRYYGRRRPSYYEE
jgi:uncharacterized membrane protein YeaQ/YmgE (transglycosylase-associated protein family)